MEIHLTQRVCTDKLSVAKSAFIEETSASPKNHHILVSILITSLHLNLHNGQALCLLQQGRDHCRQKADIEIFSQIITSSPYSLLVGCGVWREKAQCVGFGGATTCGSTCEEEHFKSNTCRG